METIDPYLARLKNKCDSIDHTPICYGTPTIRLHMLKLEYHDQEQMYKSYGIYITAEIKTRG